MDGDVSKWISKFNFGGLHDITHKMKIYTESNLATWPRMFKFTHLIISDF